MRWGIGKIACCWGGCWVCCCCCSRDGGVDRYIVFGLFEPIILWLVLLLLLPDFDGVDGWCLVSDDDAWVEME